MTPRGGKKRAVFRGRAAPADSGDGRLPSSLNYFLGETAGQNRIVPSQLPLATVRPSGANATQLRNSPNECLLCPLKVSRGFCFRTSHTITFPSLPAETSDSPSGENAIPATP